jgi:DNA invertase Pin-like site-specific DNA recombinase
MMEQYAMYLRKSRKDDEAEKHNEGDTLARHEKLLFDLARKQNRNVTKIFREVVSGDTIDARPQMQELLRDVEQEKFAGVLVVEVERLGRGDTKDQGRVSHAFKYSETLIITPQKTYDPNDEHDEEYFEFGLFMSRRELKSITRRLQRGRRAAVNEGKYPGNKPPYGYSRVKLESEKGWILEPNPEQAEIVRMIYEWYTHGITLEDGSRERIGVTLIARRLNKLNIVSQKGKTWASASIRDILINPVYIGKVRWDWRPHKKKMLNGEIITERPRADIDNCIITNGRHEGIIDPEVFNTAQELIKKNPPRPIGERYTVKNPWAGLIVCGKCGLRMTRRPYKSNGYPDTLLCQNIACDNISSHLSIVESRILTSLGKWLSDYRLQWDLNDKPNHKQDKQYIYLQKSLSKLDKELETLNQQLSRTHDLLEQDIYTTEMFLERTQELGTRIQQIKDDRNDIASELHLNDLREQARTAIIPNVEKLLDVFHELPTPGAKNDMLKEILEKVVYTKDVKGTKTKPGDAFEITLYPKLPMSV